MINQDYIQLHIIQKIKYKKHVRKVISNTRNLTGILFLLSCFYIFNYINIKNSQHIEINSQKITEQKNLQKPKIQWRYIEILQQTNKYEL